uniref:Odorant receptor n=1 Tax=Diabrotica virgifera virgifera TaxID=50390 RepID=A0A6P7FCR8_DIAVI
MHTIAGLIILYNKTGTWKALLPYITTMAVTQPGCVSFILLIRFLNVMHEVIDTISRDSKTLPLQDTLFEKYCIKQVRDTKIIMFLLVMFSFFVHLLIALPSVFKDYNINILYWLFKEYYVPPYQEMTLWISCIAVLIESFVIVYPLIFMGYFNFHICHRFRCLANYIEHNFDIRSNHDTYAQNSEDQEIIYTKLKAAVEYYLNITRSFSAVAAVQNLSILLLGTSGLFVSVAVLYFISTDVRPDANYRMFFVLIEVIVIVSGLSIYGQTISDESAKLNNVFYKCPWIYWNNKNRRMLIIILLCTKEFHVSFYNLVNLNHQIITKGIKWVYSLLAVAVKYK